MVQACSNIQLRKGPARVACLWSQGELGGASGSGPPVGSLAFWRNAPAGSSSGPKERLIRATVIPLALAISLAAATTAAPRAEAAESAPSSSAPGGPTAAPASNPTAVEADAFLARAEQELTDLSVLQSRASWVNSTYITDDTDVLAAHFAARQTEMAVRFALEAARFRGASGLSEDARRKLDLLRSSVDLPAPTTTGAALELSTLVTRLTSAYGKGHGTLRGQPIVTTPADFRPVISKH